MNLPAEKHGVLSPMDGQLRQPWIDFARGIGVILVVYGHVLGGLVRAGLFPDGQLAGWMDYTLYTFHMPLFFFLTGLNVQQSLRRGSRQFLSSKIWTIAYPYVLWSLIQGTIIMLLARDANIPILPSDLAAIAYRPIGQFWFLYALMLCHILAVLLPGRRAFIAIAILAFAMFEVLPVRPDLALTLHHLPFYVAGVYGVGFVSAWRPSGTRGIGQLVAIWLVFCAAVAFGEVVSGRDSLGIASLPACVLGITGVVWLSKLLDGARHRWLSTVGVMSMTIYVLHILAGSGIRIAMLRLHVPPQPWLYLAAGTLAGTVLPMLAHAVLQRLRLLSPLGLAPWPRRRPAPAAT